jgi:CDP-paratose synthetase
MILITGATGYLGSNLLRSLVHQGKEVIALKRSGSNTSRWTSIEGEYIQYNIDDGLEGVFKKFQVTKIIHTATCYGKKGESKKQLEEANLLFPQKLVELGIKYGLKTFYNTSTSLPPELNAYALFKDQFSNWLADYQSVLKVIHIVPEYFYGPGDDPTKFVTMLIKKMRDDESEIDLSPCTQRRDFFYVEDLIEGFESLLSHEEKIKSGERFPIGSGDTVMLKDLVLKIAGLMNYDETKLKFGKHPIRNNEVMNSFANLSKLNNFDWRPKVSLKEGLIKTINY